MPNRMKRLLAEKEAKFYVIDANKLAAEAGMGRHTNTTLQAAFFKLNPAIMDYSEAEKWMKKFAYKTYIKKGEDVVQKNYDAIDKGTQGLREVPVDPEWKKLPLAKVAASDTGDTYYDEYVDVIDRLDGDELPTSAFKKHELLDGTMNENITFRQKRGIADRVPVWNPDFCIQCNQCAFVCPHATIRPYLLDEKEVEAAPEVVKAGLKPALGTKDKTLKFRIQVSSENCVGCGLCVSECMANVSAKKLGNDKYALKMVDAHTQREQQIGADWLYANVAEKKGQLPAPLENNVKGIGFKKPYMEVSGACAGCGEAPYYRLVSQLFGKDMLVANATGCSSLYCGSTPLTPFVNDNGKDGPAWANSLFEDNAEYGFGMRIASDQKMSRILAIIKDALATGVEPELEAKLNDYVANVKNRDYVRELVPELVKLVKASSNEAVKELLCYERDLVDKSVWIVGGDGWSFDIGYGGVDHVLANEADVNILVSYNGPSLIICYCPCAEQHIKGGLVNSIKEEKKAVECGYFTTFRYDPRLRDVEGKSPLTFDCPEPDFSKLRDFIMQETRFAQLPIVNPEHAEELLQKCEFYAKRRYADIKKFGN